MTEIFREIDEELRRDNLLKLWARYGRYVIAAAALALLIAGGIVAWRNHLQSEREAQSLTYASAFSLVGAGKNADAAKVFGAIAQEGGGYAVLAPFEQAAVLAKEGDGKGAIAVYEGLARKAGIDPVFRDLATLLAVMHELPGQDPKALVARLRPLTAPGNPWRPTALELTAIAEIDAGDKTRALAIYKQLAADPATPRNLRARAGQMAAALAP
ncbi:MAG TPA: tetratricopeptide repeat protein [Stellaceae bacterium]|nr:tetratricopeptide repeat protein [Stellaceae bacterium]